MKGRSLSMRMIRRFGAKACIAKALNLNETQDVLSVKQAKFVCEMHMFILDRLTKKQFEAADRKAMAIAIAKAS